MRSDSLSCIVDMKKGNGVLGTSSGTGSLSQFSLLVISLSQPLAESVSFSIDSSQTPVDSISFSIDSHQSKSAIVKTGL